MKAIEIQTPGNVAVVDVEKPTAKSGEVLLKLDYVGFCGSDLNTYRGGNAMVTFPRIPGHEIGATIVELGSDVPSQLKVGQTVTVNPYTNCGHCASCRRGV